MGTPMMVKMKISVILACLVGLLLTDGCISAKKREAGKGATVEKKVVKPKERPRKRTRRVVKHEETRAKETEEVKTAAVEEYKQEEFHPKMPGKRIAHVQVPGPYVALTFDDGPSAAYTPRVLDILRRHRAKATFFVLGENAVHHKDILARAAAEGHEIGSHTWSHVKLTSAPRPRIESEMKRTAEVIREATGRYPAIMRPPYGASNERLQDLMMSLYGMPSILWDVDTADWRHPGVDVVVRRAVSRAKSGSIILLHDIHASTLAAVEGVVTGLQRRGFRLVTVSELIEMGRRAASGRSEETPRSDRGADSSRRGLWLSPSAESSAGGTQQSPFSASGAQQAPAPVGEALPAAAPAVAEQLPAQPALMAENIAAELAPPPTGSVSEAQPGAAPELGESAGAGQADASKS